MKYVFLLIAVLFLTSCNKADTTAPIDDCTATSDSTKVCGETEFEVYGG